MPDKRVEDFRTRQGTIRRRCRDTVDRRTRARRELFAHGTLRTRSVE